MDSLDKNNQIIIYNAEGGEAKIEARMKDDAVWLSQKQMVNLFDKDVITINEHIKNVFLERELAENSTIRKFRIVRKERVSIPGKTVQFFQDLAQIEFALIGIFNFYF